MYIGLFFTAVLLFLRLLLYHAGIKCIPHGENMLSIVKRMSAHGSRARLFVICRIRRKPFERTDKAVAVGLLYIIVKQDVLIDRNIPQKNRNITAHCLKDRHGEQLVERRKEHDVSEIIDGIHLAAIDNAWEGQIGGWIFDDFPDFLIAVRDLAKGKSACPQKLDLRQALCAFHKVEHTLARLQLTGAYDGKTARIQTVFFPGGTLVFR